MGFDFKNIFFNNSESRFSSGATSGVRGSYFFGTKRKKEKLFLVLDIGTEAVKILVCRRDNSKVTVLGAAIQYFERYGVFNGKIFEVNVIKKSVLKAIEQVQSKGQNLKKLPVLLTLGPNILKARVSLQSFKQDERLKTKISKIQEKAIFQQVLKKAQEEIYQRFSKESGILPKDMEMISLRILEMKINGYSVSKLQGYIGKDLEIRVLATFLLKHYLQSIKRIFADLELKILKIVHLAESLPFTFFDEKTKNGVFFDVGGETSQFFLVKRGSLEQIGELRVGGKAFSQKLSDALGIDEESARILKERYASKLLSREVRQRIREILLLEKRAWQQDLELKVGRISSSNIQLFGGSSLLPEVQELLSKSKIIYPKDFKNIKDETNSLKSPQYIPCLLTCYYG